LDAAVTAPLRVLHLQTDTGLSGGIAGYISTLVRSPAMRAHQSVVVVPGEADDPPRALALYGQAQTLALPPTYSRQSAWAYLRALDRLVHHERVDVIHAHALRSAMPAAITSWRSGVPLVYTNHGLRYTQKRSGIAVAVFRELERQVCRQARAVVAIRPHDARVLQRADWVPVDRLHTIETRINPPWPAGIVARPDLPLLIGVGSLIEVKRVDRFLNWVEALQAQGSRFQAVWAGEGPLRPMLEAEVSRRSLPVRFVGQLDRSALGALYASATLLLLSSSFEVFPLSVLEAAAHGVPVISSRFDGIEDIVDAGRTGLLVDGDDAAAVGGAVAALLADRQALDRLGVAARARFAERFAGPDLMVARYTALYDAVARRR